MKTLYKKLTGLKNLYSNDHSKRIPLLMLIFFIFFGIISLYLLLNTAG